MTEVQKRKKAHDIRSEERNHLKEQVQHLKAQGMSNASVAEHLELSESSVRMLLIDQIEDSHTPVTPGHYHGGGGQWSVGDFIRDNDLNFHRGNVIKYVSRAGKKNPDKELEDLKKAAAYLENEIAATEKRIEQETARADKINRMVAPFIEPVVDVNAVFNQIYGHTRRSE